MTDRRSLIQLAAGLVVLLSAGVLVVNAFVTSSARVSATTEGTTFFSAGVVDLVQPGTAVEFLFDDEQLYPGRELSACLEVEYRGSIPASVRLHGSLRGGTGLEEFTNLTVAVADGESCADSPSLDDDGDAGPQTFSGGLDRFATTHQDFATGLILVPRMVAGERVILRASASLLDDNRAQGLTTDFSFVVEARP
ncbi:MAG: hypothetical protein WBM50_05110 [Acidimicrobiales bacterium]